MALGMGEGVGLAGPEGVLLREAVEEAVRVGVGLAVALREVEAVLVMEIVREGVGVLLLLTPAT